MGPNNNFLAMATNSPALRIMDLQKPFELKLCEGHTDILNALDATSDGKWIATASKDGEAKLWIWNDGEESFGIVCHFPRSCRICHCNLFEQTDTGTYFSHYWIK